MRARNFRGRLVGGVLGVMMKENPHLPSMVPLSKGNGENKEKAVDKGSRVKGRKTRSPREEGTATFPPKVSYTGRTGGGQRECPTRAAQVASGH